MKGRLAAAGACAVALAAPHALDGIVGIAVAAGGLALAALGIVQSSRRPQSLLWPALGAAGLAGLALWPSGLGARGPAFAWPLGLACAVGLLAIAPSGPAPRDRIPAGAWVRSHAGALAALLALVAAFVAAPFVARAGGGAAYRYGLEWIGPYGGLLAAVPVLALLASVGLAALALRRSPAAEADPSDASGRPDSNPLMQPVDAGLAEAEP